MFLNHWHPIPQPTQVACRGARVQRIGPVAQIPQTPSFSGQEALDVQLSPTCPLTMALIFILLPRVPLALFPR